MLDKIFKNTFEYKNEESTLEQKNKGQFFTSLNTAKIMGGIVRLQEMLKFWILERVMATWRRHSLKILLEMHYATV